MGNYRESNRDSEEAKRADSAHMCTTPVIDCAKRADVSGVVRGRIAESGWSSPISLDAGTVAHSRHDAIASVGLFGQAETAGRIGCHREISSL